MSGIVRAAIGIAVYVVAFICVAIYFDWPTTVKGPALILMALGNYCIFGLIAAVAFWSARQPEGGGA